ncbi:hypothetical protein HQ520_06885 [bacterium]|nr:hypothetical protein [bacterium]
MYTLDEIIASISGKGIRGPSEEASDTVDTRVYLRGLFGVTDVRVHRARVPLSELRILQPDIELWRYLRLSSLPRSEFRNLVRLQPLIVVRGPMIQGYPLLQGNHRALFALMHEIKDLPVLIHVIADREAAFQFAIAAESHYRNLEVKFGSHGVTALREAYKRLLSQVVHVGRRERVFMRGDLFTTRTSRYRELREENETISAEIPCISVEGYIRTLQKLFNVKRADLRLTIEDVFYRGLVLTQGGVEVPKLERIRNSPRLLDAPILLARTRLLDYVVAGHTRLRARLEMGLRETTAICLHIENDAVNHFLDQQADQPGYLTGNEGIRRLKLI